MVDEKLWSLVVELEMRSRLQQLKWEATAKRCLPNNSWRVCNPYRAGKSDLDLPDYVIKIINKEGQTVESASDAEFTHLKKAFGEGFNPFFHMKNLFEAARRNALGGDTAIDSILSDLHKLPDLF